MSTAQRKRPLEIWKQEPGTKWPEEKKKSYRLCASLSIFMSSSFCPLSHPSAPFELWQLSEWRYMIVGDIMDLPHHLRQGQEAK